MSFLLHFVIPSLGLVLSVGLLAYAAYRRFFDTGQQFVLAPAALWTLCAVALLCDLWIGVRPFLAQRQEQAQKTSETFRAARQRFTLPHDVLYGELLIPAGSLINRIDPFDKGEPVRPLALHGVETIRFVQPVRIAGVWASALQIQPMRLELAEDAAVGPVYRYDEASKTWVVNQVAPALQCRKGQRAVYQVPHIAYDLQAEVGKPAPDGPWARFRPSEWMFRTCENGAPILVEAAHPNAAAALAPAPALMPPALPAPEAGASAPTAAPVAAR
jgi:hypothetical protein